MTDPSTHYTTCPLCEATCGLEIRVQHGAIERIAGDKQNPFSRGFLCPKGAALKELHEDPDRLHMPLVREPGGEFREVGWSEAFARVEQRLLPISKQARDAVAVYLGNPNVHSPAGTFFPRPLLKALGTRNVFTASTVDQMPKHVACGLLYGDSTAITVPDIDRTDYLLMLGANPWESNGSLCTAPDFPGRLKALLARGGRFVVVDPRRTRTAEHASEHIQIRPGTDAHLLLGIMHVVFKENLVRLGGLAPLLDGVDELAELVAPFTPAAVSRCSGVSAATIERLARDLAQTERAVVYGRMGTQTVSFGTLAAWAVDALNAITGHLDVPGGAMWALPAHARRGSGRPQAGFKIGAWTSRVKAYPEVRGEFPVATLADEIETPGEGQVRALITVAGNPVLSTPHSARLDRALSGLEFMLSVDPYLNETTRHAHVILPPPSMLTRSHFDMVFAGFAVRNFVQWSPPLFEHAGPSEAEILARLGLIASGRGADADPNDMYELIEQQMLKSAIRENPALASRAVHELAQALEARTPSDRYIEILVRAGAYGDMFGASPGGLSLSALREHPHGIDLGPLQPRLPERLKTASGKVELAPALICQDLARLTGALEVSAQPEFLLIGRRDLRSNNSWMHNVPLLIKGRSRCTLQMHPQDATRLGLANGQSVRVKSRVGELLAPVDVTDSIMPGVVSLPHGFGHDLPGVRLGVAGERPGVNVNLLTDSECLDPLSGNAVLNGVPVTLSPS